MDRGQIPVFENFAKDLGYPNSSQLRGFLNGELNYSKKRIDSTVKSLGDLYNVNDKFLRTGHGHMYKSNKPYVTNDSIPLIEEHENVLSIGKVKRIRELEEENQRLKEQLQLPAAVPTKIFEAFVSRSVAAQEVLLELLAGLTGSTFEEVFAKVRNKEVEFEKSLASAGNVYSSRI